MISAGSSLGPVDLTLLVALLRKALHMRTMVKKDPTIAMQRPEASTGLMIIFLPFASPPSIKSFLMVLPVNLNLVIMRTNKKNKIERIPKRMKAEKPFLSVLLQLLQV
jgi:hypothetical protein